MSEKRRAAAALLGVLAVFTAQYAWVKPTNFSGYDEWLYISLASRWVLSFPYENRPLVRLWHLPPAQLMPHDLFAYYVAHGVYLFLAAAAVFVLTRRLRPGDRELAFLASVFAAVWVPTDHSRLNVVGLAGYSGFTLGALSAMVLFMEAARRRSRLLMAAASGLAIVTARGTEAAIPLMAAAPLLLFFHRGQERPWPWVVAWEVVMAVAAALAVRPLVFGRWSYQSALGLDLVPTNMMRRLAAQLGFHLWPLLSTPLRYLAVPAVPLSAAIFWAAFAAVRSGSSPPEADERRSLVHVAALGFLLACLGYAAFVMSARIATPVRTQFLSGAGIALLLASIVRLVARTLSPGRLRRPLVAALAGWVVAVGAGRTMAMQRDWDAWGSFPAQNSALVQLTAAAPELQPNTLVVLLDDRRAFPASFTFRHAVDYLYQGRALGHVWGASDYLYPASFTPEGIRLEPWELIRRQWRSPATFHRYDEVVVAHYRGDGTLVLLQEWPRERLPALPPPASYRPSSRIVRGAPVPPERGILKRD